jgi:hypothetical protein
MAQQIILAAPPNPMLGHHHFPNIKWPFGEYAHFQTYSNIISSQLISYIYIYLISHCITMIFLCCTRLIPEVWGVEATNYHWFFFKAKHLLENLRHSDSGEYDQVPRASGPADGRPFSVWLSFCLSDFPKNMRDA